MSSNDLIGIQEICLKTRRIIKNPFWDVDVVAEFYCETEESTQTLHGFYDGRNEEGEHVWKIRWAPAQSGRWTCKVASSPEIEGLCGVFEFHIAEEDVHPKGYLRARPNGIWRFWFDNGEPAFLFGDTQYNIFGAQHNGVDVESILRRRKSQGVNYIRARMQVSPYHPDTRNTWQTRDCWPWGGSSQFPDFDRLNLEYFRAVDEVAALMARLDMGLEVIFEAWLLEFPFNDRNRFVTEYEEMWFKYIVSRYAAYPSVYVWCPANEYEFYPNGQVRYHLSSDRWMKRLAGLIRQYDPYRHPIGAHNWEQKVPLWQRLGDAEDIDLFLVQSDWGDELWHRGDNASRCRWMKSQLTHHTAGCGKAALCSEFGYEQSEKDQLAGRKGMDHHHTRRGQWRAGFLGFPVVHGFNNTWGPHMNLEPDCPGTRYLPIFHGFMTQDLDFSEMAPNEELFQTASGSEEDGTAPMCLSDGTLSVVAVYFPAKGECELKLESPARYEACWLNPRTGEKTMTGRQNSACFSTPQTDEGKEPWGDDWVLLLKAVKPAR